MYWELWDLKSKSLVEEFATEDEALQAIREILALTGEDLVNVLALVSMYDEGEPREVELPPALKSDALRARLAESASPPVVGDAVCAMHERIREWLTQEGWRLEDIQTPGAVFHVLATQRNDGAVTVAQDESALDRVVILRSWYYDEPVKSLLQHLAESDLNDLVWNVYRDTSIMGVDFHGIDTPTSGMFFQTYVYSDGLTKDTFMHRVHLTNRAFMLALRTFVRTLQASIRSHGNDLSPEDFHQITRLVPPSRGPLTAAS